MKIFCFKLKVWIILIILVISFMGVLNISLGSNNFLSEKPKTNDFSKSELSLISNENEPDNRAKDEDFIDYYFEFKFELTTVEAFGQNWDRLYIKDCYYNFIAWEPRFPIKTEVFELFQEITSIDVKFSNPVELKNIKLEPVPEPGFIIQKDLETALSNPLPELNERVESIPNSVDSLVEDYLSKDTFYPPFDNLFMKLDDINIEDYSTKIYTLQLFPFKYNPKLRSGVLFKSAMVRLYYDLNTENTEITEVGTRSSSAEPEAPVPDLEAEYLILTTKKLIDELEPLIAWKQRKGLTTKIVDLDSIYQNASFDGYDQPDEIRNFIMHAHKNLGTRYVLLAGDYDTVPTRMCYDPDPYQGADDGEIPADSYYACISDDTTWDVDGDHVYGELGDLDDIYPDLIVSRIAINQEQKMIDWVSEVINYECTPADAEWTDKAILIGPNVHNTEDGAKQSEYFYNKYLKYVYGTFDKFYEDSDAGEPLTKADVIKSINYGSTFLNYLGHGGPSTWTYNFGYSKLIDKGDVNRLTNKGMKPLVYAMSCLTQWFDDPTDSGYGNFGDCIGETFTENVVDGGIGYIGSSRTSVGIINQNYGPFATGLQEDYISQIAQLNFGLGSSYTEAKKSYSKNWGNYFPDTNSNGEVQACWLEVNLLGEPELTLWTKAPEKFIITNETNEETLKILVRNDTGAFIKDAQVCIQLSNSKGNLEILQVKKTSSNGEAEFYIYGFPEKLNLTISKTNFIPYLERITVADLIPPITDYEINPIAPDGENEWYVTAPIINLTINEEGKTYYYWDDGPQQEYSGPIFALEGDHIFNFYSVDEANNIEVVQNIKIKVDLTPPECKLGLDPSEPNGQHGWYTVQPSINFTSETNSSVYYAFDEEISLLYTDPLQAPEGIHEIHYYSKDIAGNKGMSITETIKVDIIPPKTTIKINPSSPNGLNGWYTIAPTISFESEEESETFYYWSSDDNDEDLPNSPSSILYQTPISCPEGKNVLYYYSKDYAGCTEGIQSYNIKLDTQPPGTEYKINPEIPDGENGFYISTTYISFSSEPNATIFYNWDDKSSLKYTSQIKVPEGIHTLTYYSMDDAGNYGEELTIELKVDTIAPTTNVLLVPPQPTGNNDWYTEIPIMEFESELDAEIYYHFEGFNDIPVPVQLELPEGITKIYYHSEDAAGNIGSEEWMSIKVDVSPPEAILKSDESTYKVVDTITFYAGQSKDKNGIDSYYIDFGDGENTGWIPASHVKHKYKKSGEYTVTLKVIDNSGQENEIVETFDVLIIEESNESDSFLLDDVSVIVTFVIGIFIVLTALFIFTYKRYNDPVIIPDRVRAPMELEDDLVSKEIPTSRPKDLKEAIIMDKPVVFKMKKIKCPGCGSVFMGDEHTDQIKCPNCGLQGKLPSGSISDKDINGKGTDLEYRKETTHTKFKCPACGSLFRTRTTEGYIKCPGCGIKGQI